MMMAIRYYLLVLLLICVAMPSASAQQDDPLQIDFVTNFTNDGNSICLDVNVSGFDSMELFQFTIRWDPTVLDLTTGTVLPPLDSNDILTLTDNDGGLITIQWLEPTAMDQGLSLEDGSTILQYCFDIIGDPCTSTNIYLSDNPTDIEFIQRNGIIWNSIDISAQSDDIDVAGADLTVFASHCNTSGPGVADGNIRFYPCGGEEPYTWSINGTPGTDPASLGTGQRVFIPDLIDDTYTIVVTDNNGNTASAVVMVEPSPFDPVMIEFNSRDPNCFYRENGRIIASLTSDLPIVKTEWSNGEFSTNVINNLGPNIYTLSVTDQLGCVTTASDTLTVDTLMAEVEVIDSAGCGGQQGLVRATASGGVPFDTDNYYFNGGFPLPFFVGNVDAGPFDLTVADDVGCEITLSGIMPIRDSFDLDITTTNISCNSSSATLSVVASGPFQFDFDVTNRDGSPFTGGNPSSGVLTYENNDIDLGGADSLQLIITTTTTPNSCQRIDTVTLYGLQTIDIEAQVDNPGCDGTTGDIDLTVTGGAEPYSYLWNDNSTAEDRIDVSAGTYTVTVTDADNCTNESTFEIIPGGSITTNISVSSPVSCPDGSDGSLTVDPTPNDDYTFTWRTSLGGPPIANSQTATGLSSGWYYVAVSSNTQNCVEVDSIFLSDGEPLRFDVVQTPPTCPGFMDGSLAITVTNGEAPFSYQWEDDPTMDDSRSLLAGINGGQYNVTVSDARGCEVDTLLTLVSPNGINLLVTDIVNLDCSGQTAGEAIAIASGGASGTVAFAYLWSSGEIGSGTQDTATNLSPGTQWVIATDGECASDTIFFEVEGTPELSLSDATLIQTPRCINDCNGAIDAAAEGGQSPYTFTWQDSGETTSTRTSLCAGQYIVEITDATGCTDMDTIDLPNPDSLLIAIDDLTTQDLPCGDALGQIGIEVTGGAGAPYTFQWSGSNSTDAIASDLNEGEYTVTVNDASGCVDSLTYTLTRPEDLEVVLEPIQDPTCFGDMTCVGIAQVTGGLGGNYRYQVPGGPLMPIDTCIMLFAGTYDFIISDANNTCSLDTTITIDQPQAVEVDAGPDIEIDLGQETELINLEIFGPSAIDTILWTPLTDITCVNDDCQTITAAPTSDQTYIVTVMDDNGCVGEDDLLVSVNTRRRVAFPNIFRPGSTENGTFQIGVGNGVEQINYCNIYDRWGNMVWSRSNYLPQDIRIGGWDGTYKGKPVTSGVYTVLANVTFTDGVDLTFTRTVTVIY